MKSPTDHYFTTRPASAPGKDKVLTVRIGSRDLQFASGAGVFSKAHLDDGSQLLIRTFASGAKIADDIRILDLGCGWGAVGCFVAALHPQAIVAMCDINERAAAFASRNARLNALTRAHAWCGDGAGAAGDASFDFVLCNPPVRVGNAVIARLFQDAHRCLKPGGSLWIVLRTAQGAKSWQRRLADNWGNCETRVVEGGFRILCSTKT